MGTTNRAGNLSGCSRAKAATSGCRSTVVSILPLPRMRVPMSVRNERLLRLAEAAQAQQEEESASSMSRQEEERSDEDGGAGSRPYRPAPGSGGVEAPY